MGWHIPNEADAPEDPRQAALQSAALDELADGLNGTGVVSGFGYTPAGGRTITVAAGVSAVAGVTSSSAGGSITLDATSSTQNRVDLVAVDEAGALVVVEGTPVAGSALPAEPSATGGLVALFVVFLGPSTTTISADNISDRRVTAARTDRQGAVAASVILMVPSLTPAPGDLIYLMLWAPGTPAALAVDSGAAYDCPENWVLTTSYENDELYPADPAQRVLLMLPGDPMPTAYASVQSVDFTAIPLMGGQIVSVGCGGAGLFTAALWVGSNTGAGLGGFIDPKAPATSFAPHSVTGAEVQIGSWAGYTGTLGYAETGVYVDTAAKAFTAIDAFDLTAVQEPLGVFALAVADATTIGDITAAATVLAAAIGAS